MTNKARVEKRLMDLRINDKYEKESRDKLLHRYTIEMGERLDELTQDIIENHDFMNEVQIGASRLRRKDRLRKVTLGLERHAHAPELNCLHFHNGRQLKVSQLTSVDEALTFAALSFTDRDVEIIEADVLKSFRK